MDKKYLVYESRYMSDVKYTVARSRNSPKFSCSLGSQHRLFSPPSGESDCINRNGERENPIVFFHHSFAVDLYVEPEVYNII